MPMIGHQQEVQCTCVTIFHSNEFLISVSLKTTEKENKTQKTKPQNKGGCRSGAGIGKSTMLRYYYYFSPIMQSHRIQATYYQVGNKTLYQIQPMQPIKPMQHRFKTIKTQLIRTLHPPSTVGPRYFIQNVDKRLEKTRLY